MTGSSTPSRETMTPPVEDNVSRAPLRHEMVIDASGFETTSTPPLPREVIVPRDTNLPPPPPGVRYVLIPLVARVVIADDDVRKRADRFFYWPMIILALALIPLLAWEFLAPPPGGTWWWWLSAAGMAVIWTAFFVEFVIKISIAESRFEYARRHWLDIVVLLIPILRPLRVAFIARTTRVFTLRGVAMKFLQYAFTIFVGLEATDRLRKRFGLTGRRDRTDPNQMTRHELITEVKRLRRLCDRWTAWQEMMEAHLHVHRLPHMTVDAPREDGEA